jgi:p-cumate 2,3-dioxygenase alpha subunit
MDIHPTITAEAALQIDEGQGRFRVARAAYVDPGMHSQEMEAVFSRCWLFVGHDTEIPKPNDFVTRTIAGRPVIFLRDREGQIRCFLNVCPHRGAQLVRHKSGSMRAFNCIYHGWGFENTGRNVHIAERDTYAPGFDKPGCNDMVGVPRFEQYRGLWFLNFDPQAISLDEYLGAAKDYVDIIFDQAEEGMRVVGEAQEYSARANWKLLSENSTDILHVATLHPTYLDLIRTNSAGTMVRRARQIGASVDLGNGHTVVEREASYGRPIARWIPIWGEEARVEIEGIRARLDAKYGVERANRMSNFARNVLIFPNLVINDIMSVTLRTFQPTAVNYMEISVWAIAPAEEVGKPAMSRRLTNFLEFLGPAGFATPDDIEAFESCQRAYGNYREAPWNDFSKGMNLPPDPTDELPQRIFWLEWQRRMAGRRA